MDATLRQALWGILRPLLQLVSNLLNPEIGEEWTREFGKFIAKRPCWMPGEATLTPSTPRQPLLANVNKRNLPAISKFIPSEKFKKGTQDGVKVVYADAVLDREITNLVEENIPAASYFLDQLIRGAKAAEIHTALEGRLRSFFAHIWEQIKLQGMGQEGDLHIDGKANLWEVEINGIVWFFCASFVYWYGKRGWYFRLSALGDQDEWFEGRQVSSRDPGTPTPPAV